MDYRNWDCTRKAMGKFVATDLRAILLEWLVQQSGEKNPINKNVGFDTNLFETGLLSSLKIIELIIYMESLINKRIDLAKLKIEDFKTINQIHNVIFCEIKSEE